MMVKYYEEAARHNYYALSNHNEILLSQFHYTELTLKKIQDTFDL